GTSVLNLRTLTRIFCVLVCAIGLAGLAGWMFDISLLKSGIPGRPPMLLSSGVVFILCSVCLLIFVAERDSSNHRKIGKAIACVIFVIAFCSAADGPQLRAWLEQTLASALPYQRTPISYDPSIRGGLSPLFFALSLF